jgi:hypothetical protein
LKKSEIVVLFSSAEGSNQKELRFQSRTTEPLKTKDEIAFDLRITETSALMSKDRRSVLMVKNIFNGWSEERILKLAKREPAIELPEEPEPILSMLKFYDQFGRLLMEETKKSCGLNINARSIFYMPDLFTIDMTFAISDNGERFILCRSCEPRGSAGCFVYSPRLNESYQLKDMPHFGSRIAFSPDARYVAFYHDILYHNPPGAVTFLDLETKQSTEIPAQNIRWLKVLENATVMIEHDIDKRKFYDFHGQVVKDPQNR